MIDPSHLRIIPTLGRFARLRTATFFVVATGTAHGRPTQRMLSKRGEPGSVRQWLSPGDPDIEEFLTRDDAVAARHNSEVTDMTVSIVPAIGRKREVLGL